MEETSSVFTDAQKKIINKELREIVLLPDQYPQIVFKSTSVSGKAAGANQYDLKINGDLTLHGVTRQITIPTKVTVMGNDDDCTPARVDYIFQPSDGVDIQVVRRLVQQQDLGVGKQRLRQQYAQLESRRDRAHKTLMLC